MTKKELINLLRGAHDDAEIVVNINADSVRHEGNRISSVRTGVYTPKSELVEITI